MSAEHEGIFDLLPDGVDVVDMQVSGSPVMEGPRGEPLVPHIILGKTEEYRERYLQNLKDSGIPMVAPNDMPKSAKQIGVTGNATFGFRYNPKMCTWEPAGPSKKTFDPSLN